MPFSISAARAVSGATCPSIFRPGKSFTIISLNGREIEFGAKSISSLFIEFARGRGAINIPPIAIVDGQSIKAHFGENRANDIFKKVIGRKRSILVDTLGFLLSCYVHKANDQDCHGCLKLFSRLTVPASNSLEKIIDRKEYSTNMVHKRWIVERSFAWFNHYRRLSRDYEKSYPQSEAMIFISQIQPQLRRAVFEKPSRRTY